MLPLRALLYKRILRTALPPLLAAFIGLAALALYAAHYLMQENAIRLLHHAADAYGISLHAPADTVSHLASRSDFRLICIYDKANSLTQHWHAPDEAENCPAHMVQEEIRKGWTTLQAAIPIQPNGIYEGMLYSKIGYPLLTIICSVTAGIIFFIGLVWVIIRRSARNIDDFIQSELECAHARLQNLRDDSSLAFSAPSPASGEIHALTEFFAELHSQATSHCLPESVLLEQNDRHWNLLSGLLERMAHHTGQHPDMLETLSDYELLLQAQKHALPLPSAFDLTQLMDATRLKARHSSLQGTQLHITASLEPGMPGIWNGCAPALAAVLRHLMLLGLQRTTFGFICLRIKPMGDKLHLSYEDSGPRIQYWQMHEWLQASEESLPRLENGYDFCWLLISRLLYGMGGTLQGTSPETGGLILISEIPMEPCPLVCPLPSASAAIENSLIQPLALVIEPHSQKIAEAFNLAGYRVFSVDTHIQALEWLEVLPVSVLVLNMTLPDAREDIVRRLSYRKQKGNLRQTDLWAICRQQSPTVLANWRRHGINPILMLPLSPNQLTELKEQLTVNDAFFYHQRDESLHRELDSLPGFSSPRIERMFSGFLKEAHAIIRARAAGNNSAGHAGWAHAVKSVALSTGYPNIAALMGQIEHAPASLRQSNWGIIAACLDYFLEPLKNQSNGQPRGHNAPADHAGGSADANWQP